MIPRGMEASSRSWEATFSLSDNTRERALHSSRLRYHRSSADMNRVPLSARETSRFGTNTAKSACKNANLVNSPTVLEDDEEDNENEYADVKPISYVTNAKRRRRSQRKPAPSTSRATDLDCKAVLHTSTFQSNKEVHHMNPHSNAIVPNAVVDVNMADSTPQTSLSFSPCTSKKRGKCRMEILDSVFDFEKLPARLEAEFFQCDALELAPKLLGKFLRRDDVVMQITEVEAYRPNDSACHGRFGLTPRTAAMFGPGGHAYVYLCYGMHVMLNIVADIKGVGAAVLIRSCAPIAGLPTIQARRGFQSSKPVLLTGPGKIGQALGLTTDWSSHPLYMAGGLELLDGPPPENVLVGPRVGINYANPEDVKALWRFAIAGTPWISAPRSNLASFEDSS